MLDHGNPGSKATFVMVDVEPTSYVRTVAAVHPVYGQGYFYLGWTVYKATATVPGGSIDEGTWFRIASNGLPSTNFCGFEATWPIDEYITTEKFDSAGTEIWPGSQQSWISSRLNKSSRGTEHAFVFSHRPLMGANHVDGFFGSNPGSKASQQNPFYASLADNGVRYMISGHDHIHNRALVESPDGLFQVQQIINTGASTKFYMPGSLDSFAGSYGDVKGRETQISQEVHNVGYYIYTVDGPRVTVDYYSDTVGNFQDGEDFPYGADSTPSPMFTPQFEFVKKETWGYSTNGQQFQIAQGNPYTVVTDSFGGTIATILAGTNQSTATDYTPTIIDDKKTPDPADDVVKSAPRPFSVEERHLQPVGNG